MKRIIIGICLMLFVFASSAFALSVMTFSIAGGSSTQMLIAVNCTSHTDGTFTASTKLDLGSNQYWNKDFSIAHAYVVNNATGQPDTAATVTIADEKGQQLIGSTVGDTLTVSTSASGVGYLSIDRGSKQRSVTSPLYITIGDTQSGTATSTFTLYILLSK